MNINKAIFRIALPAIISNITVPLLGFADTAISGHLGSDIFLAAIAVGSMMVNVMLWCLGFLRSGTSGMTAQAYGEQNINEQHKMFASSLGLGLIISLILIALQYPLTKLLIIIISPEETVSTLASQYFNIMIWSTPAILGVMAVSGWFLGMQTSVYPMIIAIVTNIINIIASLIFVFICKLGFTGTALGTCLANWLGFILALILAAHFNKGKLPWGEWRNLFKFKNSSRFFRVNADIFLRSMCIMSVSLGMTSYGASISSLTLAVNAVMMQFFLFFSYFMDGFAFAAEALVGKYVGASDKTNLHRTDRALLFWSIVMVAVFSVVYYMLWPVIIRLITPETTVIQCINHFHIWIVLLPTVSVAAFIYDGMYIGLTATRPMLFATLTGTLIFFIANTILPTPASTLSANTMLWIAFLSYLFIRGLALAFLYPKALSKYMPHKHG